MIVTLTLNPAVDKTLTLETFVLDGMNRATASLQDPGGKGINVSKVIHALGGSSVALGFIGGASGVYIESELHKKGIETDFVVLDASTRTNLKIFVKDTQHTIEVNEQGEAVSSEAVSVLLEKLTAKVGQGDVCVLAGSVPAGIGEDFYPQMITRLKEKGAVVIFDADGPLFKAGVKAAPDYIKPNRKELEAYFERKIEDPSDFIACGKHFLGLGVGHVVFSLGSEGSFYMDAETCIRVHPLKVEAQSSVGAGDAFVGALAFGVHAGLSREETLKLATATSAGAVTTKGTNPASKEWVYAHKDTVSLQTI